MIITAIVLFSYIIGISILCFKSKQLPYLCCSILLWLVLSVIGARILPGVFSLSHLASLYPAPLYFCMGSLFYFCYACSYHFNRKEIAIESDQHICLGAITFANLFVQIGFLLITLTVSWLYPPPLKNIFLPDFLIQYSLQPIWLIGIQLTIAGCIILYTKLNQQKTIKLGLTQMFFFCALVALTVVIKTSHPILQTIMDRALK